jgi:hypothetical protein
MLEEIDLPLATLIADQAFSECSSLQKMNLPFAKMIGLNAFFECSSLLDISLPNARYINAGAFCKCPALENVSLPMAIYITSRTFSKCYRLRNVNILAATYIESDAFSECAALDKIDLPLCTSISSRAFYNCSGLQQISFPALKVIGEYALAGCSSLKTIDLPFGLVEIGSFAFSESGITDIVVPSTVNKLGIGTFGWAANLGSLALHKGNWSLPSDIFLGCAKLTNIYLKGAGYNPGVCAALDYIGYPQRKDVNVHVDYECTEICGREKRPAMNSASLGAALLNNKFKWNNTTIILSVTSACGIAGVVILSIVLLRRKGFREDPMVSREFLLGACRVPGEQV